MLAGQAPRLISVGTTEKSPGGMAYETFRRGIFLRLTFVLISKTIRSIIEIKFLYNLEGRIIKGVQRKEGRVSSKKKE